MSRLASVHLPENLQVTRLGVDADDSDGEPTQAATALAGKSTPLLFPAEDSSQERHRIDTIKLQLFDDCIFTCLRTGGSFGSIASWADQGPVLLFLQAYNQAGLTR